MTVTITQWALANAGYALPRKERKPLSLLRYTVRSPSHVHGTVSLRGGAGGRLFLPHPGRRSIFLIQRLSAGTGRGGRRGEEQWPLRHSTRQVWREQMFTRVGCPRPAIRRHNRRNRHSALCLKPVSAAKIKRTSHTKGSSSRGSLKLHQGHLWVWKQLLMTMAMTELFGVSHIQTAFVSIRRKLKHMRGRKQPPSNSWNARQLFQSHKHIF